MAHWCAISLVPAFDYLDGRMSKALENLVTSDDAHDLELLFARIDELEGLVKRQKDFIDHSSDTWRRLLSEKQARLEEVMDDRQRIEVESTELVKIKVAHEGKIASLEEKISEFPKILNEERDSVAEENRLLSEKISSLKEEMFDRIGNLEKIGLNLVADTHFSPNVEEYIERISLLEGALATIESELRQREEEIEQTRSALGERLDLIARLERELKDAKALEETLREKLEEANGWVFSLAGERAENEKQLTRLLRDRDAKSKALHDALLQVSRLSSRVDELGARLLSGGQEVGQPSSVEPKIARRSTDSEASEAVVEKVFAVSDVAMRSGQSEIVPQVAFDAQPALLMEAVKTRDKQQLLERLHVIHDGSRDNPQVPAARPSQLSETSVIERGGPLRGAQPMPVMVSARSNELERKLREARELAEWHLRVSAILLAFPKRWLWRFAPLRWRRKRLLELLQREGLFDGSAYLERYPDVAEAGMDPFSHYLLHGLMEGRVR